MKVIKVSKKEGFNNRGKENFKLPYFGPIQLAGKKEMSPKVRLYHKTKYDFLIVINVERTKNVNFLLFYRFLLSLILIACCKVVKEKRYFLVSFTVSCLSVR